jgi:ABC-type uncharacterized transport system auxiliary subunit
MHSLKANMRNSIILSTTIIILLTLNACTGIGKVKPSAAIYDFGLTANTSNEDTISFVFVNPISSAESLNTNRIRYRLNFENPTQVFTYAESHWASAPAELLTQKLKGMAGTPSLLGCHLNLQLLAFDQVFDNTKSSSGIAQISASLFESRTHKLVATEQFQSQISAEFADARGGVKALNVAGGEMLKKVLEWSNKLAASNANCR